MRCVTAEVTQHRQQILLNGSNLEYKNKECIDINSPQAQSEDIREHNQTGSEVWERMLGDEGDQQGEYCYQGDEDASQDPRSVETRS